MSPEAKAIETWSLFECIWVPPIKAKGHALDIIKKSNREIALERGLTPPRRVAAVIVLLDDFERVVVPVVPVEEVDPVVGVGVVAVTEDDHVGYLG